MREISGIGTADVVESTRRAFSIVYEGSASPKEWRQHKFHAGRVDMLCLVHRFLPGTI
jgi:hypothetical protein